MQLACLGILAQRRQLGGLPRLEAALQVAVHGEARVLTSCNSLRRTDAASAMKDDLALARIGQRLRIERRERKKQGAPNSLGPVFSWLAHVDKDDGSLDVRGAADA